MLPALLETDLLSFPPDGCGIDILGKDFVYFMWEAGKNGKPAYAPASVFDIKKDATDQLMTEVDVTLKSLKHKKL